MTIYEFYWRDDSDSYNLLKVVEGKSKIRNESLLDLARKTYGDKFDLDRICLIQIDIEDGATSIYENPCLKTSKEYEVRSMQ